MTGFWKNWMTAWCWGVMLFGVVLAGAATPATDAVARLLLGVLGGDPARAALLDQPEMRFAFGLQGALTLGWGMTLLAARTAADVMGAPLWRSLTMAFLAWYVIDSAISAITGFPLNAVSNTLLMAAYLAPVLGSGVLGAGGRTAAA